MRSLSKRQVRQLAEDMFGTDVLEMFSDVELANAFSKAQAYSQTGRPPVYPASPIKRHRATSDEMEERAQFLIAYAREHHPVTVRGLYYQAEVAGIPGIGKDQNSYNKVQNQVLRPRTFDNWQDALETTALTYRRSLWQEADVSVEIWCEKDALAGVISKVTSEYDVPLMVSRGFTSETFAYEAVNAYADSGRPYVIFALYDFDRSGADAARSLQEKVERFGDQKGVDARFNLLGLTQRQVRDWNLPTRLHKRETVADRRWSHPYACELDAIPPGDLRSLVQTAIEQHLPAGELARLQHIEELERETMLQFLEYGGAA
jgi:hypothetical protein